MKADPGQKRNLARKHPEVVEKLQSDAVAFLREERASDEYIAKYVDA